MERCPRLYIGVASLVVSVGWMFGKMPLGSINELRDDDSHVLAGSQPNARLPRLPQGSEIELGIAS